MKRIPKFIAEDYGSSHAFRANKRFLVSKMLKDLSELRRGAAYFPTGSTPINEMQKQLDLLRVELSTRKWGK